MYYCDSLVNSVRIAPEYDVSLFSITMSYDALIQRARNDLVALAIEHKTDMVFIDSDMRWEPRDLFKLLSYPEDVVGATVRKKTDSEELYNINTGDLTIGSNGLIKVNSVGTGFLKVSQKALQTLWDNSEEYTNSDKKCRMIFDVRVIDGELFSEDNVMCRRLRELGFEIFVDPRIVCGHFGVKCFEGDFMRYREEIIKPQLKVVNAKGEK